MPPYAAQDQPIIVQLAALFRTVGVGWVMWLLIGLSVVSVAIMVERALFFIRHAHGGVDAIVNRLADGDLEGALALVSGRRGLTAEVLREGARAVPRGAGAVEEMVSATIVRQRLRYEQRLSYLGTLGNNAPFIGLFGTVLGIVEAFAALAATAQKGAVSDSTASIMTGISQALVATAVGLLVALPAVAVYNLFSRWLKTIVARGECVGHALASHLKTTATPPRP
jgi:biopolymer transport protein ExbB